MAAPVDFIAPSSAVTGTKVIPKDFNTARELATISLRYPASFSLTRFLDLPAQNGSAGSGSVLLSGANV